MLLVLSLHCISLKLHVKVLDMDLRKIIAIRGSMLHYPLIILSDPFIEIHEKICWHVFQAMVTAQLKYSR